MFDAYNVKKMIPRAVIAVIGIQLSWYIFVALIDIINLVAYSLEGIIYAPFGGASKLQLADLLGQTTGGNGLFFAGLVAGSAAAIGAAVSLGGVVALAISAMLALFIGFILLMVRKIVIVFLLILSPLALVAWILPGTEKYWKLWWESFFKLLLLYPMVLGTVAMGRVFAWTAATQGSGSVKVVGNISQVLIILIGCFGPFFLIPKLFTLAGHAFANITGAVNNRQKGAFDRLRNARQNKQKQNLENLKAGQRYKGSNFLTRRANTGLQTASLLGEGGATLSMAKRRQRMSTARNLRDFDNASKFMQENAAFGAIKGDDDKMWALMNAADGSETDIRNELKRRAPNRFADPEELNRATAEVMRAKREGGSSQMLRIAATRAQFGTGTGYNYRHDGVDDDALTAVMAASGDDGGLAGRIWAEGKGVATQSGRVDIGGGGFAKTMQIKDKLRASQFHDAERAKQGLAPLNAYTAEDARREMMEDVIQSNAGAAVAGKVEAVKQLAPVMKSMTDDALASGDAAAGARALASIAGKYDAASQIAPQNAEALSQELLAKEIDVGTLPPEMRAKLDGAITDYSYTERQVPDGSGGFTKVVDRSPTSSKTKITYQAAIEALRGDADFQTMRREYQSASTAAASAAAQQQPGGGIPQVGAMPGGGGGGPI